MNRQALLLFVFLNAVYVCASSGRVRTTDEYMALFQTESLVLRGSTAVPQAVAIGHHYGKFDPRGEPRAPYAPLHATAATPFYVVGRYVLARAPGVPAEAGDLVLGFAVVLSSATFAAAAVAAAFWFWRRRLDVPAGPAAAAALLLALATPLLPYSAAFFSEPLAAALLVGAAAALAAGSVRGAALAGALAGIAVLVRPPHVILGPVFALALIVRDGGGRRGLLGAAAFGAAFSAGVAGLLAYNAAIFGSPFEFGYPSQVEGGVPQNTFDNPVHVGVLGFLFSPGKSIFLFAPPVLVALAGLPALWRRERALAVVAALAPLAALLFYARFRNWEGGYCFGPRYLVPSLALACLAIGPALAQAGPRLRRAAIALALAGLLVNAVGMATSFLEDQRRGGYYDERFVYRLSHAPLASQGRLLVRYATSAEPAPLGLGFDRWFVFLRKGGVAPASIAALLGAAILTAAASGLRLRRALAEAPEPTRNDRAPQDIRES